MKHSVGKFTGAGGLDLYYQGWQPDGQPRAVLTIVHGIGEHSGRYMNVVSQLVPHGYAVYSFDNRGHGRSPGQRGYLRAWAEFREDVRAFLHADKELHIYPDGYHEPHNDLQHEQVTADLENWLERHL